MNPEILHAVAKFRDLGILDEPTARLLTRVNRRELVSVKNELRALLSLGILLVTSGVGLVVKENLEEIGPLGIATALTLGAVLCLFLVARRASLFSWSEVPSPGIGFDALLLLGVLLLGADLGFIEARFHLFGEAWPYHLLLLSLVQLLLAYRFDSRTVLSLALSTFAAWRGLSPDLAGRLLFSSPAAALRANALACGTLFLAGAFLSNRRRWKAHFEQVWGNLGLLLLFAGLLMGVFESKYRSTSWMLWEIPLMVVAAAVIAFSLTHKRPSYFAQGAIATYLGAMRILFEALPDALAMLVGSVSSLAMLVFLAVKWRSLREES